MRIYVAGPYTNSGSLLVSENVNRAMDAGIALIAKGHIPFIPHLTHFLELRNRDFALQHGIRLGYDDYMRVDIGWLAVSDALLYLAPSPGADLELAYAKAHGLTLFFSLDDVPDITAVITTETATDTAPDTQ